MKYGQEPIIIGKQTVQCKEMMFYQDMPIKMSGESVLYLEERLYCFSGLIETACQDFIDTFTFARYMESYVYISAKYLFQNKDCPYNRPGWHCDGFMTDDINYIWSDTQPTIFNVATFNLSQDDKRSIREMNEQADEKNNISYGDNTLIRLDQHNVHRVAPVTESGMRAFFKLSVSDRKYDLLGNAHNCKMKYNWNMRPRSAERNVPQLL